MRALALVALAAVALVGPITGSVYAAAGDTTRVSVDSSGNQANMDSGWPTVSADGRFVAFNSRASNLVAGDTNGVGDVFVRDRQEGTTERASVDGSGNQANGRSHNPTISVDGRHVAFESIASNLVVPGDLMPGYQGTYQDVFVRDQQEGTTERVSVDSSGGPGAAASHSHNPSISADGRYVAFESIASYFVADDTGRSDVFVHERGNEGCTITGTSGADVLEGASGDDVICGLGGNDQIKGMGGDDSLKGGTGDDTLLGGEGGDTLLGWGGGDTLLGGEGDDALLGGAGGDTASYEGSAMKVTASLGTNSATGEGTDAFAGIENLTGSAHNDTFTGSSQTNRLTGSGGADRLYGSGGSDELYGGSGSDTLRGGSGSDGLLEGGSEADKLYGEFGHDRLKGGEGDDTLLGGEGDDTLDGSSGNDTASFEDSAARVEAKVVNASGGATGEGSDALTGIENLTGSSGDDTLDTSGGVVPVTLKGLGGDDTLLGRSGNKYTLEGGTATTQCTATGAPTRS